MLGSMFGIHEPRFLDIAIIDYFLVIIASMLISYTTKIPVVLLTIVLFILGIITHKILKIKTSTSKYLGID